MGETTANKGNSWRSDQSGTAAKRDECKMQVTAVLCPTRVLACARDGEEDEEAKR